MAILKILEYPDPRLRKVAVPVSVVTEETLRIADDMLETMYDADGVGLAATQVNIHQRIIVMDVSETRNQPQLYINPEYEQMTEEKSEHKEGCLSVPGVYETVACRYDEVKVKSLGRDGKAFSVMLDGLGAICIQHECDHLNGKVFVDYLSLVKQERIRKQLKKNK